MFEIKNAMNDQLAQFFISVAGIIIMVLLAAIAYFLQKWINSTDMLTESVHDLKTTVALLQTNQGNSDKMCNVTHKAIENRLNDHNARINEHGTELSEIRETLAGNRTRRQKQQ